MCLFYVQAVAIDPDGQLTANPDRSLVLDTRLYVTSRFTGCTQMAVVCGFVLDTRSHVASWFICFIQAAVVCGFDSYREFVDVPTLHTRI